MAKQELPADVTQKAVESGGEWVWRKEDLIDAVLVAKSHGLATLGGDPRIILPDGILELYWLNYDPAPRKAEETWIDYCARTAEESIRLFQEKSPGVDATLQEILAEKKKDFSDQVYFSLWFGEEK